MTNDALAPFGPATRQWFQRSFSGLTEVQTRGFETIARGDHALLLAPTGSGKTLAAFLWAIDRILHAPVPEAPGWRVIYVSPLKALAYDVDKNLRVPLAGIQGAAEALGVTTSPLTIDVRTGDTPQRERERQLKRPGDVLITTPESLFLMLLGRARGPLSRCETIIVDEVHVLVPEKRGAHLAVTLERLSALVVATTGRDPQRVGLSATQRPPEAAGRFLVGPDRPITLVDTARPPNVVLRLSMPRREEIPVARAKRSGRIDGPSGLVTSVSADDRNPNSLWQAIHPRLVDAIRAHHTTLVFVNNRRLAERLCQALNELAGEALARPHHGSMSHEQRRDTEEALKEGRLRAIIATSSLELGIDMGSIDLVVMVESPGSVGRGLQRVGRAGHQVGATSHGWLFPKFAGDLLEATVVAQLMREGQIEPTRPMESPLDVLAQHLVAECVVSAETGGRSVAQLLALVRKSAPFAELDEALLRGTLDMLSGHGQADVLADVTPRLVWDRATDVVTPRPSAKMVLVANAGTIPDRGLYRVTVGHGGPRIGELDEEMVLESRVGEVFLLGASGWRILEIGRDAVVVEPAPGQAGKMPFWRGEGPGRPIELGRAVGAFTRTLAGLTATSRTDAERRLVTEYGLDADAATALCDYLVEQVEATKSVPSDRTITVERFKDEVGDWRVAILTPFGARVHAPWALALDGVLAERTGVELHTLFTDDGILLRFASFEGDSDEAPALDLDLLIPDPGEIEPRLLQSLDRSALFAARFRENAARALLLPRRRPDQRKPLWQQRLKSAALLAAAAKLPAFPIMLETFRECLRDVFDLPALRELLGQLRRREIRVEVVETRGPSPFARSLMNRDVAQNIYELDAPLAERRAHALVLDQGLLRILLGEGELRELLDTGVIGDVEAELQHLTFKVTSEDGAHDLLRRIGDLSAEEAALRGVESGWLDSLVRARRIGEVHLGGEPRFVALEDVARLRDALDVVPPRGVAAAWLERVVPRDEAFAELVLRYARTHGPFTVEGLSARWAVENGAARWARGDGARVRAALDGLTAAGRLVSGQMLPGGRGIEWCHPDVLRQIKRRTLARLRREVEPVDAATLSRFVLDWQGVRDPKRLRGGVEGVREALLTLEGLPVLLSEVERTLLPARVAGYRAAWLDEVVQSGDVVVLGHHASGQTDGWVVFGSRDRLPIWWEPPAVPPSEPAQARIAEHLARRGACFLTDLARAMPDMPLATLVPALFELWFSGHVTNDSPAPLRALLLGSATAPKRPLPGGRWWLVAPALIDAPPTSTERAHLRATLLLERYGVVAQKVAASEGVTGGFAAVYPVLQAMEESGRIRRGHFVDGLDGAQFALPGVVDRLRAVRSAGPSEAPALVVGATDPALIWGALVPWPDGASAPRRLSGAQVVLVDGVPVLWLDGRGERLVSFVDVDDPTLDRALAALPNAVRLTKRGRLTIDSVGEMPVRGTPWQTRLKTLGFQEDPRGLVLESR